MPVAKQYRRFYRGPAWEQVREDCLKRCKGLCEDCGKPHRKTVYVTRDGTGRYCIGLAKMYQNAFLLVSSVLADLKVLKRSKAGRAQVAQLQWIGADGKPAEWPKCGYIWKILVIVAPSHQNHTPGDDRPENIRGRCQGCHLRYDRETHRLNRAKRRDMHRPVIRVSMGMPVWEGASA
jgi:hypothetical protein